ncbi:hypothetical protein JZ751_022173, partial [Albula glossodonta]
HREEEYEEEEEEDEENEEEEEQPTTKPSAKEVESSRQGPPSGAVHMAAPVDVEKAGSLCLPCKCVVSVVPNAPATEEEEDGMADAPSQSSMCTLSPDSALRTTSPQPSVLASLLAQRKSSITVPASSVPTPSPRGSSSRGSSVITTPSTSPTVERLPYLPHSPFHLFSYDFDEDEAPAGADEGEAGKRGSR